MKLRHLSMAALLAAGLSSAMAQDKPCQDPCVPEAKRHIRTAPSPSGEALRDQALLKLKQRFDDADADRNGSLTQAEAKGFGFVAAHFAKIDRNGQGAVSFEDVRRYLAEQKQK